MVLDLLLGRIEPLEGVPPLTALVDLEGEGHDALVLVEPVVGDARGHVEVGALLRHVLLVGLAVPHVLSDGLQQVVVLGRFVGVRGGVEDEARVGVERHAGHEVVLLHKVLDGSRLRFAERCRTAVGLTAGAAAGAGAAPAAPEVAVEVHAVAGVDRAAAVVVTAVTAPGRVARLGDLFGHLHGTVGVDHRDHPDLAGVHQTGDVFVGPVAVDEAIDDTQAHLGRDDLAGVGLAHVQHFRLVRVLQVHVLGDLDGLDRPTVGGKTDGLDPGDVRVLGSDPLDLLHGLFVRMIRSEVTVPNVHVSVPLPVERSTDPCPGEYSSTLAGLYTFARRWTEDGRPSPAVRLARWDPFVLRSDYPQQAGSHSARR